MMKYCPFCGSGLQDEMIFCPKCGKKFQDAIQGESTANATSAQILESETSVSRTNVVTKGTDNLKSSKIKLEILCTVVLVIIAVTFGFLFSNISRPFSQNTKAIEASTESVVKITCYDHFGNEVATGSGFIAFDDRTVVTNWHVIEDAYSCEISTEQDKTFIAEELLCCSEKNDIAVLLLSEPTGLSPLPLGDSNEVQKGETITAIGSPLGLKNSVSQGVLSGRITEDSMYVLQFTAPISSGSSGGALLNEKGEVIGITYASYINGQNLNLAIPIEIVQEKVEETYSNDSQASWEEIYMFHHPYTYLYSSVEEYTKRVTPVTIDELKQNPKNYNYLRVQFEGYVSSINIGQLLFSNNDTFLGYYVANKEFISGNLETDKAICSQCDSENSEYPLLEVSTHESKTSHLIDSDCQVGDYVVVVGIVSCSDYYDDSGEIYVSIDTEAICKIK